MNREKAAKAPKKRKPRSLKALADSGLLTPLQSPLCTCLRREPQQEARGHHFKALAEKSPDVIANMGITLENVIENHILPKMNATEIKFFQHEGKVTDQREVETHMVNLHATRTLLELMGPFPPEDPVLAAKSTVDVIVVDMPEQQWPDEASATPSNGNPSQKQITNTPPVKKDPRPKD
jgi:hypothetical protein